MSKNDIAVIGASSAPVSSSKPSASSEAAVACSEGAEGSQFRPIEITPEMIDAGMEVFMRFEDGADDPSQLLCDVFRSMLAAHYAQA